MSEHRNTCIELTGEVERFLYQEAWCLDERRYRDWIGMFADDGVYLVPTDPQAKEPQSAVNIAYENLTALEDRVSRLETGFAHAQDPPSHTTRSVSNVVIDANNGGVLVVRAVQNTVEWRMGALNLYSARLLYHLRHEEDGGFAISFKRVDLVNAGDTLGNLTFIL